MFAYPDLTAVNKLFVNDCIPKRLRYWVVQRQRELVIRIHADQVELFRQFDTNRESLGLFDNRFEAVFEALSAYPVTEWRMITIELPDDMVLVRQIRLPVRAKEQLRQVVTYELDRFTPFQADEIFFDVQTIGIYGIWLDAQLAICRRDSVATTWLERLKQSGYTVNRLTWDGAWPDANLLPAKQRAPRWRLQWLVHIIFVIVIVLLLVALLLSPLWQQRQRQEQLEQQLRMVRHQAAEVPTIRDELERAKAGSFAVLERKARQPRIIDLLRELTDRLPDDTWVQTINYREEEVDIRGQSGQATALLGLLAQAPGIDQVTFRSPVMQVSQTGKERFHISFVYKQVKAVNLD
jgi:general secretion pathway protein L